MMSLTASDGLLSLRTHGYHWLKQGRTIFDRNQEIEKVLVVFSEYKYNSILLFCGSVFDNYRNAVNKFIFLKHTTT